MFHSEWKLPCSTFKKNIQNNRLDICVYLFNNWHLLGLINWLFLTMTQSKCHYLHYEGGQNCNCVDAPGAETSTKVAKADGTKIKEEIIISIIWVSFISVLAGSSAVQPCKGTRGLAGSLCSTSARRQPRENSGPEVKEFILINSKYHALLTRGSHSYSSI